MEQHANVGFEEVLPADTSPILLEVDIDETWYRALQSVESGKGPELLAHLIETSEKITLDIRLCLADLIRRKFNPNAGKRAKALCDLPKDARKLFAAAATYRELRMDRTKPSAEALAEAAQQCLVSPTALEKHLKGKHTSTRELMRERKALVAALGRNEGEQADTRHLDPPFYYEV